MTDQEKAQMVAQVATHFIAAYGSDRALWICKKLFPAAFDDYTAAEAIQLGEKLHRFNLILKEKV